MLRRRRFKQRSSLSERMVEDVEQLKKKLETLPRGTERDLIIRRIRQNETAAHIDESLRSPGLQPPVEHMAK